MIPTTTALLICVVFLCGLEDAVLAQRGYCTGSHCFALFQEPADFPTAQKGCKDRDGELLLGVEHAEKILRSPPSGRGGSYWLASTGGTTEEAAAGLQSCSAVSGLNSTVLRKQCRENLDGFLCQYRSNEPCSGLKAGEGARVKYTAPWGFAVTDLGTFPSGTIAVAEKAGGKHPESKHVCAFGDWMRAPWPCEVLHGGCGHHCNSTSRTCTCPAGQTLHPNNITCTTDPCAECAHGCQQEGDRYACKCGRGYRLAQDGTRCVDVNECEEEEPCTGEGEECKNTQGGFECRCKDGFEEEGGVCVDVDICLKCEHLLCEKPKGFYECVCRKGFRVSAKDPTKCELDCTERDCPAKCVPEHDDKQCFCPEGYIQDIKNGTPFCTDINECEMEEPCEHKCENVFGGYRCLCNDGFRLRNEYMCVADEEDDGSGSTLPFPTAASADPAAVPSYVRTGSVLGITAFASLCAALLLLLIRNTAKRCGSFELSSFKRPDIDIFYLQQVTTETYKRLSVDKQFKNDSQIA